MKKSILALFSFFLSFQIFAQINIRIGPHSAVTTKSFSSVPAMNFASVEEGRQIIQNILDAVGRTANFEIRTANIDNAAAVAYGGKRYILYNPNFINALDARTGTRWASISVLAHEIGHHLLGHTVSAQGSQPALELQADEFSGYALRRMGASLQEAEACMQLIASQNASATHPGKASRLAAIEKGWSGTSGTDVAQRRQPTRPVQTNYPTSTQTGSQSGSLLGAVINILGQVLFNQNSSFQNGSYVTDGLNVLRMINNNWYNVGKLSRLNNSQYPFMINGNSKLYVDRSGKILNRNGQYFGMLRAIKG